MGPRPSPTSQGDVGGGSPAHPEHGARQPPRRWAGASVVRRDHDDDGGDRLQRLQTEEVVAAGTAAPAAAGETLTGTGIVPRGDTVIVGDHASESSSASCASVPLCGPCVEGRHQVVSVEAEQAYSASLSGPQGGSGAAPLLDHTATNGCTDADQSVIAPLGHVGPLGHSQLRVMGDALRSDRASSRPRGPDDSTPPWQSPMGSVGPLGSIEEGAAHSVPLQDLPRVPPLGTRMT